MKKTKRWWIFFFVVTIVLISVLAASWNFYLVQEHFKMMELAKIFSEYKQQLELDTKPWLKVIWGSVGFFLILTLTFLFFFKTLKEMQANQIYRDFLDKISHELKSPLTTLELTSALLKNNTMEFSHENKELWAAHDNELQRLKRDVELLLESSRWQNNKTPLQISRYSFNDIVNALAPEWKKILGPNGSLYLNHNNSINFNFKTDYALFKLICQNIIDNARKYSKNNLAQVSVITQIDSKKNIWQITFRDQGFGFESSMNKKIFDQFFRIKTDAPYSIPGSGLGLYLSKQAARSLSLKLKAHSEGINCGAEFTLEGKMSV
jgi:K+-sensing histidine kinase KdpD